MRLKTFSPSMYKTFNQCRRKVQYSHIDRLCTVCFKGETGKITLEEIKANIAARMIQPSPELEERLLGLAGSYACKSCLAVEVKAPQLQRGIEYDEAITSFILGRGLLGGLPPIANKAALQAICNLYKARAVEGPGHVRVQEKIWLDAEWNLSPETGRSITLVLDVLVLDEEAGYAQVIDWKTGSLTKTTGKLKSNALEQYIDQLEVYALGVLAKYPKVNHVDTACYFLDDPSTSAKRHDSLSYGRGENYEHVKERWTRILKDTLSTERFDPSSGWWCGWCPYSNKVGGPCEF